MKKISYIMLLLIFTTPLLFSGCTSQEASEENMLIDNNAMEQLAAVTEKEDSPPVLKEISLNGGYTETNTDSENVKESFSFLKMELLITNPEISLIKVQKAETQIVAGWKIRLVCEYIVEERKELYILKAVIYKDLAQNLTLKDMELNINK